MISKEICITLFNATAEPLKWFILPFFLVQVSINQVLGEGEDIIKNIKSVFICFLLLFTFPYIIELILELPNHFLDSLQAKTDYLPNLSKINGAEWSIIKFVEVCSMIFFYALQFLHALLMIVMCSIAPIVFIFSTLLGVGFTSRMFFGILIGLSTYPIIHYGTYTAMLQFVKPSENPMIGTICEVIVILINLVSPVVLAGLAVKSPIAKSVMSGLLGAKSIVGAGQKTVSFASSSTTTAKNFLAAPKIDSFGNKSFQSGSNFYKMADRFKSATTSFTPKKYIKFDEKLDQKKVQVNQNSALKKSENLKV